MKVLLIDEAGHLHPNHESNQLIFGGVIISEDSLKRMSKKVKKILAKIKKDKLENPELMLNAPDFFSDLEQTFGKNIDFSIVYLDKTELYKKNPQWYTLEKDYEIRKVGIQHLTQQFISYPKCYLETIIHRFGRPEARTHKFI